MISTYGTSLTARGGWQPALQDLLQAMLGRQVEILNQGQPGAASDWGVDNLSRVLNARPDVVLIEFSINDAAMNRRISQSMSRANHATMIDRFRAGLPGVRLYVQLMNPCWGRPRLMRPRLDAYMSDSARTADAMGVGLIDHRPRWDRLDRAARRAIIPDGLHPDPALAGAAIAGEIATVLQRDIGAIGQSTAR
ncbi:hypothetical protein BH10PSE2_BH10PSE2_09920 [soil metagenome]